MTAHFSGGRIHGIDLARGLAIIGMLLVHIGPTDVLTVAGRIYAFPHGKASILFALVAGVGVSLLARGRQAAPIQVRRRLAWLAAIFMLAGLSLELLDHHVLVVLHHLAPLYLLGALCLRLPGGVLLALAATMAVAGPVAFLTGQMHAPEHFDREPVSLLSPPGRMLHALFLSGPYPLLTWSCPFLLGMWLGRRNLREPVLRTRLMVHGAAAGVAAVLAAAAAEQIWGPPGSAADWTHLGRTTPHSQMIPWLLGATGTAAAVLGVSLWAAARLPRLTGPLVVLGHWGLTIYVAHLLLLHVWFDSISTQDPIRGAFHTALLVIAAMALSWPLRHRRGPAESLLHIPFPDTRHR